MNRVFRDKHGGLVVDYIGIANDLKQALKEYTTSKGRGRPTVDAYEAYAVLEEKLDVLRAMLHDFDYSGFLTAGPAGEGRQPYTRNRRRQETLRRHHPGHEGLHPLLHPGRGEGRTRRSSFLQGVKVLLTKREMSGRKHSNEEREAPIRQIIDSTLVSEGVVDIFDAVGLDKPNIGILDDQFLEEVRNLPERDLVVELLERLLEGEIRLRFSSNVVQQAKFSDLLANVIKRYQNRAIKTAR